MVTNDSIIKGSIKDDFDLLTLMVNDVSTLDEIYKPGPYWLAKTKLALKGIKKYGLSDFRGSVNGAANSFGDNALIDYRGQYNNGVRSLLGKIYRDIYPFNRIFDNQVSLTTDYFFKAIMYQSLYLQNNDRVKYLLENYIIPEDTTRGGCLSYGVFNEKKISLHYLQLLDTLDYELKNIDIKTKHSFFEIGGGFGVNTHLLLENEPSIKKVIYLDIAPNLYVGTQYLKSFYGESVKDYSQTRKLKKIILTNNNDLEIFCITPSQIELIDAEIDWFHNAHSFVEMPKAVVKNYANHIERLISKDNGNISLVSYDKFDLNTTFHPNKLTGFFTRVFNKKIYPLLAPRSTIYHQDQIPYRSNYHFWS